MQIQRLKINRILVPTDFSEMAQDALNYAVYLAALVKADIYLLHLLESSKLSQVDRFNQLSEGADEELRGQAEDMIRKAQQVPAWDESIRFFLRLSTGNFEEGLEQTLREVEIDLVIMATAGANMRMPLSHIWTSTHANKAVKHSSVPVLTLRELPQPVSLRNILLPLDLTEQTTHKVDLAIQMAKLFDARLHLVAVSHYFETIRGAGQKLEDRMEEEARRIRSAGIDCSTEQIPHDDVASSVIAYSEEIQADLIFLVTAREGRFDRLFLGSRASRVIGMSTRPVLSIKPASLKGLWEEGS